MGRGLPALIVTGLPGAGVQDARERVRPAVEGAKLEWPLRRVVVNLAPANVRKEGPGLDLPLVMSVLAATRQIPSDRLGSFAFAGEVSLKGELLTTPGILTVAIAAATAGVRRDRGARRQCRRGRTGRGAPGGRRGDTVRRGRVPPGHVGGARRGDTHGRCTGRRERGPGRGARTDASAPCPRGRGGRWSQHAHGGFARCREDHARPAAADDPARALARGIPGSDAAPFGGRTARFVEGAAPRAPVPRAAPFGVDGGAARRWQHLRPTRRSQSRAPRRPVPRRAHRVPARRRRGTATTARGRPRRHHAGGRIGGVPGPIHPRGRGQPVSVRLRRGRDQAVRVQARPGRSCTGTSCRDRCSIGSTSGCASLGSPRKSCWAPRRERRPREHEPGSRRRASGSADDGPRWGCRATRTCRGRSRAGRVR